MNADLMYTNARYVPTMPPILNVTSLREQVYSFFREEMQEGRLRPGATINLAVVAQKLGVSKTPLREALIQLESEGFVEILPRRGVRVATLTLRDVRNLYQIIGALEASVIVRCPQKIGPELIGRLEDLNERMRRAVEDEAFDVYYLLNLEFHGAYVDLSENEEMRRLLDTMKQRLYDFPRRFYLKEWEARNCGEHGEFIGRLRIGDLLGASRIMRDVHWSFETQEDYIRRFYSHMPESR